MEMGIPQSQRCCVLRTAAAGWPFLHHFQMTRTKDHVEGTNRVPPKTVEGGKGLLLAQVAGLRKRSRMRLLPSDVGLFKVI